VDKAWEQKKLEGRKCSKIRTTICVSGGWVGVDKAWEQKKLEGRKCSKIRTLPTRPLHAVLDELLGYGDCVLIIVLKLNQVLEREAKKAVKVLFRASGAQGKNHKKA